MSRVVVHIRIIYTYTIPVHGRMPRPQNKFHNTGGGKWKGTMFTATDFELYLVVVFFF